MLSLQFPPPRSQCFRWDLLLWACLGCQFESSGTGQVGVTGVGGAGVDRTPPDTWVGTGGILRQSSDNSTGALPSSQTVPTAGGSTAASCAVDAQCPDSTRRCKIESHSCVACLRNSDCPQGSACDNNGCTSPIACQSDADCTGSEWRLCDVARGLCVRCASSADCPLSHECRESRCEAFVGCASSFDCPSGRVCEATIGRCTECNVTSGCPTDHLCNGGVCRQMCVTDADCSASAPRCDTNGSCVPCLVHADCRAGEYCNAGECVTDRCSAGESRCFGASVEACNEIGDGYVAAQPCPTNETCVARLGRATCVALGTAGAGAGGSQQGGSAAVLPEIGGSHTGGVRAASSSQGGASPVTDITPERGGRPPKEGSAGTAGTNEVAGAAGAAAIECAVQVTAKPCDSLPQYTETQVVDGFGDDFCKVPAFELNFTNADKVIEYTRPGFSSYPERAIAHVAWSEAYVHVFVRVEDPFIETADQIEYIYGADSIELMITADDTLAGNPAENPSAMHIIAGPWANSDWGMAAGALPNKMALPWAQYAVATDATGYSVELKVPWPNGMTVRSTTLVYFDMALNAAVEAITGQVDVRDAQAIYKMGRVTGDTCGEPWCDDDLWCPTYLR